MPREYRGHDVAKLSREDQHLAGSNFPGGRKIDGVEEWLSGAVIQARSVLNTDMAFFFINDQLSKELTAYISIERTGGPQWKKLKWEAGEKEITGLFEESFINREKVLKELLFSTLGRDDYSLLLQPVQLDESVHGLIGAGSFRPGLIQSNADKLLGLISSNITGIWEKKDLQNSFVKLQKEIDALLRFSKYLSSNTDDLEVVLENILEELKSIIDVESCGVLLYDPDRKMLVLQKPAFGVSDEHFTSYALPTDTETEEGIGVAVKVFLTGKPYICNMTDHDHVTNQELARIFGARSSLSVPLVVDNRRTGVIHAINKKNDSFTQDDARLLELLAYQLAIVIENARLFEQLEKKNELLRHSMDVHNKLTRLVLRDKSFDEIIFSLVQLIDRDIIVQDQFFKVLGSHVTGEEDIFLLEQAMSENLWNDPDFRNLMHRVNNYKQAMLIKPFPGSGINRSRLIAPITLAGNILGYVSILESDHQQLGEMEYLAIEHAVTVFTLKMMQGKIAYEAKEKVSGDFLDDLINGSYHSPKEMIQRAAYLGRDLAGLCQVLYVDIDDDSYYSEKQRGDKNFGSQLKGRVFDIAKNYVEEKLPSSMIGIKSDALVVVAQYPGEDAFPELVDIASHIKERIKQMVPGVTVSIGIGKVSASIEEIKTSYQEARRAIFIARKFGGKDRVITYESLGAYRLLFSIENDEDLKKFVDLTLGPLMEHDREKNNQILIDTLRQYLLANCNNQRTADNLYIHLNTLKYRLKKIQQVAGIDLNDPETRLNFQLALKVLEIKGLH